MDEKVIHPTLGRLKFYRIHPGNKIFHDFVFTKGERENYVVVTINGQEKYSPGTNENPPKLLKTKDLFGKPFLENDNANFTYSDRVNILNDILNTKGHKGYEVFDNWLGYAVHIDLENQQDSLGLMILSDMAGRREKEFHFGIKPYKSLEALKYQFNNRIKSRKIRRSKNTINPSEINDTRIKLSVIEDYETEVTEKLGQTGNSRLVEEEIDNAKEFLIWLAKEKENVTLENSENKSMDAPVKPKHEKIKWLGSPEQFGYIFGELVAKGYIELPTRQTEGSIPKLAELCLSYFEIPVSKGQTQGRQTTIENLKRALNSNKNTLSAKGKATIKLPQLDDLK